MGSSSEYDDAWIEAELERQLLDVDLDAESEDDDDFATRLAEARRRAQLPAVPPDGDEFGSVPESFRELMSCLQEWGASAAETAEEGLREALETAQSLEKELQATTAMPQPVLADPSASDASSGPEGGDLNGAEALELAEAFRREMQELAAEARREAEAELASKGLTSEEASTPASPALAPEAAEAADGAEASGHPEEGPEPVKMEEVLQKIEDERLYRVAELEHQQEVDWQQMREEETARRQEEARIREEVAMHHEELWAREFNAEERFNRRREHLAFARADRRSGHVRAEEGKIRDNAERGREDSERTAMAQQDMASQTLRRLEWERRESSAMAAQDASCRLWNEATLRAEECSRKEAADRQAELLRSLAREAAEIQRMAAEDAHAAMLRQCMVPVASAKSFTSKFQQASGTAAIGRHLAPARSFGGVLQTSACEDPSEALAAIAWSSAAPGRGQRRQLQSRAVAEGSHVQSEMGGGGGGSSSSSSVPVTEVDPWHMLGVQQVPVSGLLGAVKQSPTKTGSESAQQMCGSALCAHLLEGSATWRGKPAPARKRFALPEVHEPAKTKGRGHLKSKAPKASSSAAEDLGLDGLTGGLEELIGGDSAAELVRLEVRMEGLEQLPALAQAPQLRVLILSGNKLTGDLEILRHCPLLEELGLCQNALTTLKGLRHLPRLSVLKATMNEISDAEDLAQLKELRVLDLSKNRLASVPLKAPGLAKLVLYRNGLSSTQFLQHLPSLTELDLGRNKLSEVDPQISEWCPLLLKVFLYENRLASLPELRLPLLTDLWVDNNELQSLGPLGFLPSLERLQAKNNQIRTLASPIAACPLLQTLELAFNQLPPSEPPKAVLLLPRLKRLQLNDNPAAAELMEGYRPWVLRMAPQLEELDNETVSETERLSALVAQASADPYLPHQLAWASVSCGDSLASSHKAASPAAAEGPELRRPRSGLLGLVAPSHGRRRSPEEGEDLDQELEPGAGGRGRVAAVPAFALSGRDVVSCRRASLLDEWRAAWDFQAGDTQQMAGGCQMCALAAWCEALSSARSAPLVAYTRDERRSAAASGSSGGGSSGRVRDEVLFVLRRRRTFWASYLELCGAQHDSLSPWQPNGAVCRSAVFEMPVPGSERSRQGLLRRVQARWRGVLGRRRCQRLRLEKRCEALSGKERLQFTHLQAIWRGRAAREELRCSGAALPGAGRREEQRLAASKLQAAVRGSRVRRKLRWAREMSKMVNDDLEDCPEIDVGDLLGEAESYAAADPFAQLRLPSITSNEAFASREAVSARGSREPAGLSALSSRETPRNAEPLSSRVKNSAPGPVMAWGTPPATPGAREGLGSGLDGGSRLSSPQSSRPGSASASAARGAIPRRSRSLSSTAESAVTELEGAERRTTPSGQSQGKSRVEQAQEEWGFQDSATAKAYLASQRRRKGQPPALPGLGSSRPVGPAGRTTRVVAGSASSSKSLDPPGKRGSGGGLLKAQDAIAEFRRQQEEAERAERAAAPVEFTSGEPNLKLMRSLDRGSRSLLNQGPDSSPRASSPVSRGFSGP